MNNESSGALIISVRISRKPIDMIRVQLINHRKYLNLEYTMNTYIGWKMHLRLHGVVSNQIEKYTYGK